MTIWWALQIISTLLVSLKVCTTSTKNKKPAPCGDKPQPSISSGSDQSRSHRCVAPPVYSWQCISDLSSVRRETTHPECKISCYLSLQIMISNRTPLCSSTRHWYWAIFPQTFVIKPVHLLSVYSLGYPWLTWSYMDIALLTGKSLRCKNLCLQNPP